MRRPVHSLAFRPRSGIALAVVLPLVLASGIALGQGREPGDQWEVTTEMSMAGMSMPGQTSRVCSPRNADGPPVGDADGKCQTYDVRRNGGSVSWKVRCTGENEGSGAGELTYQGRDRYTGRMTLTTRGETMTLKLAGQRLGECDAGTVKRQIAAADSLARDALARNCESAVQTMSGHLLLPGAGLDCEARYRKAYCDRYQGYEGYAMVARVRATLPDGGGAQAPQTLCGLRSEEVRARLCKRAVEEEAFDFLASGNCPSEGLVIAQRECAGRSFSSPAAPRYRAFCGAWGRDNLPGDAAGGEGRAAGAAPADGGSLLPASVDDALNKGKDLLRGLFR